MLISSGVSNTCLFAPAPYYKLDKGFFFSAFCLNGSVGYANLAVETRKPRKSILYLLLIPLVPFNVT